MSDNPGTQALDDLLATIESRLKSNGATAAPSAVRDAGGQAARGASDSPSGPADAISAVLNEEPRTTAVVSLREAPAVEAFRQALTDGLIRVDTANRLLRLINEIIVRMVP